MAAHLLETLGVSAQLVRGGGGRFVVSVDGQVVARKTLDGFPTVEACEAAVREALA